MLPLFVKIMQSFILMQNTKKTLNELKSAAENKTRTTFRITKKNFQDEELPHELFLIITQKTKMFLPTIS